MKRILAILLISTNLHAFEPTDVQLHIGATYIVSSVATAYMLKHTCDKQKSIMFGIGVGLGVGIIKELTDRRPQRRDLVGNIVGSISGSVIVTIPF